MSDEYLGGIVGPADDGGAHRGGPGLGPVLATVSAVSVDVGRLRAVVDHLTAGHASTAKQLGQLSRLVIAVEQLQQRATALEQLSDEVSGLSQAVEQLAGAAGAPPPRPVDWAHVPADEREAWLVELVGWVRDVLFVGWPHAAARLSGCWPRHRDLVNDVAALRTSYDTAYDHEGGRAHHAGEFRRLLEDVLRAAETRTRDCPPAGQDEGRLHPVPGPLRDDTAQLRMAARIDTLATIWALVEQANSPANSQEIRAEAAGRARDLFGTHHISQEEYREYERALALARQPQPRSQ